MSRIRSQLDTILDGPAHGAAEPDGVRLAAADVQRRLDERMGTARPQAAAPLAPAASHGGGQDQEIQRVRDQLGKLATKLETALQDGAGRGGRQSARQSQQAVEIGSELDRLRADMTEIRAMLAGGAVNGNLARDMQRLNEAVAALQYPQETQNGQIATLAAEMRDIRRSLDDLAGATRGPVDLDMSGVARSIESGYAEIASRLEDTVNRNFAETRGDHISGQIAEIGGQLSGLRDLLNHLPSQVNIAPLEHRFGEVEGAIGRLIGAGEESLPGHLMHLEERLDEIARAMVAVSGNPDGVTNNLERIEARLATLSKTVDGLAETARSGGQGEEAELASRFASVATLPEELHAMIERIDARLDQFSSSEGDGSATLQSLAMQLETIQQQLSGPQGGQADMSAEGGEALGAIEAQLGAIFARLDGLSAGDGGQIVSNGQGVTEDLARSIDVLIERLDGAAAGTPLGEDGGRLQELEHQIGEIALLLRGQADREVAPISDRLDSIEQQLANSRDIAIDMAGQAAERAVQLAASSGVDGQGAQSSAGSDREFLEAMARDLQNIEARLAQSDSNGAGNSAVQDALGQILSRLETIERGFAMAPTGAAHAAAQAAPMAVAQAVHEPAATSSPDFLEQTDDVAAFEADSQLPSAFDHGDGEAGQIHPSPSLDMEQLPELEPAVEDVPLEPGSGVPDLAALVRDASQKRRSAESPPADSSPDYLAAARRAAKAAASEAAASKDRDERNAKADGKLTKERKGFGAALAKRRSLIMLVALVVLSAAMAGPIASRFLNGSNEVVATGVEVPASDPDNAALAEDERELTAAGEDAATDESQQAEQSTADNGERTEATNVQFDADSQPAAAENESVQTIAVDAPVRLSDDAPTVPAEQPDEENLSNSASGLSPIAIPVPPEAVGNTALRQAATQGDTRALFEIARRFTEGEGPDRDLAQAALWYEASASRGYAPAQYRLGNFLEKGHGVTADLPKSAVWYERAAERGNALAMHNLAVLHSTGLLGSTPKMDVAIDWFNKAADLGVKDSQVNLGIIYAKGLGTDVDLVKSYKWFAVAAKGGDSDAASKRDMVAEAMRPDQLETARGETELWKPGELDVAANVASTDAAWKDGNDKQAATTQRELVAQTQRLLAKHGFDPGPADGLIGDRTRDAIKRFQQETGLPVDGTVTPQLVEKLGKNAA